MIPLLAARPIDLLRFGAPTVYQGRPVRPEPTESTIVGSVQPIPDSAREWLPSGCSTENTVLVYTYQELRTSEDGTHYADRIEVDGVTYEIVKAKRLPPFLGQRTHWECYGVRLGSIPPQYGDPPPPPPP